VIAEEDPPHVLFLLRASPPEDRVLPFFHESPGFPRGEFGPRTPIRLFFFVGFFFLFP